MSAVLFGSFSILLTDLFTKNGEGEGEGEERLKPPPAPASAQSLGRRLQVKKE